MFSQLAIDRPVRRKAKVMVGLVGFLLISLSGASARAQHPTVTDGFAAPTAFILQTSPTTSSTTTSTSSTSSTTFTTSTTPTTVDPLRAPTNLSVAKVADQFLVRWDPAPQSDLIAHYQYRSSQDGGNTWAGGGEGWTQVSGSDRAHLWLESFPVFGPQTRWQLRAVGTDTTTGEEAELTVGQVVPNLAELSVVWSDDDLKINWSPPDIVGLIRIEYRLSFDAGSSWVGNGEGWSQVGNPTRGSHTIRNRPEHQVATVQVRVVTDLGTGNPVQASTDPAHQFFPAKPAPPAIIGAGPTAVRVRFVGPTQGGGQVGGSPRPNAKFRVAWLETGQTVWSDPVEFSTNLSARSVNWITEGRQGALMVEELGPGGRWSTNLLEAGKSYQVRVAAQVGARQDDAGWGEWSEASNSVRLPFPLGIRTLETPTTISSTTSSTTPTTTPASTPTTTTSTSIPTVSVELEWVDPQDATITGWEYSLSTDTGESQTDWTTIEGAVAATVNHRLDLEPASYSITVRPVGGVNPQLRYQGSYLATVDLPVANPPVGLMVNPILSDRQFEGRNVPYRVQARIFDVETHGRDLLRFEYRIGINIQSFGSWHTIADPSSFWVEVDPTGVRGDDQPLRQILEVRAITQGVGDSELMGEAVRIAFLPISASLPPATSAARHHCLLTSATGQVSCLGMNQHGQLGNGTFHPRPSPVWTSVVNPTRPTQPWSGFTQLDTGANQSCGIRATRLYCWGNGAWGQLGTASVAPQSVPQQVQLSGRSVGFSSVATGDNHTCAITTDRRLFCWGANNYGQVGVRLIPIPQDQIGVGEVPAANYHLGLPITQPYSVSGAHLNLIPVTQVVAGAAHTCALNGSGQVWCWGRGREGQLGNGSFADSAIPVRVAGLSSVTELVSADNTTCALTPALYCWGDSAQNQYNTDDLSNRATPVAIILDGDAPVELVAGSDHFCSVDNGGVVRCWGRSQEGQLGRIPTHSGFEPVVNPIDYGADQLSTTAPIRLSTSGHFACVAPNYEPICWGSVIGNQGFGPITNPTKTNWEISWDTPLSYSAHRLQIVTADYATDRRELEVTFRGENPLYHISDRGQIGSGGQFQLWGHTLTESINLTARYSTSPISLGGGPVEPLRTARFSGLDPAQVLTSLTLVETPLDRFGQTSAPFPLASPNTSSSSTSSSTSTTMAESTATPTSSLSLVAVWGYQYRLTPAYSAGSPAPTNWTVLPTWTQSVSSPSTVSVDLGELITEPGLVWVEIRPLSNLGPGIPTTFLADLTTALPGPVSFPQSLSTTDISDRSFTINWQAPSTNRGLDFAPIAASGYDLEIRTQGQAQLNSYRLDHRVINPGSRRLALQIGANRSTGPIPPISNPSFTDPRLAELSPHTTYEWRLRARVGDHQPQLSGLVGEWSEWQQATTHQSLGPIQLSTDVWPKHLLTFSWNPSAQTRNWEYFLTSPPSLSHPLPQPLPASSVSAGTHTLELEDLGTQILTIQTFDTDPPIRFSTLFLPDAFPPELPQGVTTVCPHCSPERIEIGWNDIPSPGERIFGVDYRYRQHGQAEWGEWVTQEYNGGKSSLRIEGLSNHTWYQIQFGGRSRWGRGAVIDLIVATNRAEVTEGADRAQFYPLYEPVEVPDRIDHSCLVADGVVWCWGDNQFGQLGDGTTAAQSTPVPVVDHQGKAITGATKVDVGSKHTCALYSGRIACWGYNTNHQLGNLSTAAASHPQWLQVDGVSSWTDVTAGHLHSCGTTDTGRVYCWGGVGYSWSEFGRAVGAINGRHARFQHYRLSPRPSHSVSAGSEHSCLLLGGGSGNSPNHDVFCFGFNYHHQLGPIAKSGGTETYTPSTDYLEPGSIDFNTDLSDLEDVADFENFAQVGSGEDFSCALTVLGKVFCWGGGEFRQNGITSDPLPELPDRAQPTPIDGLDDNVSQLVVANQHACVLLFNTKVRCWGNNNHGQLGASTPAASGVPIHVPGLIGATSLHLGTTYSCAQLNSGGIRCWGERDWDLDQPRPAPLFADYPIPGQQLQLTTTQIEPIMAQHQVPVTVSLPTDALGAPLNYAVTPSLPTGLNLRGSQITGLISEDTILAPAYSLEIARPGMAGASLTLPLTISVTADSSPVFAEEEVTNLEFFLNQPADHAFPDASGGNGFSHYRLDFDQLPPGLRLESRADHFGGESDRGRLVGTPTATFSSSDFSWWVEDQDQTSPESDTLSYRISVVPSTPQFSQENYEELRWVRGVNHSVELAPALGGQAPLSYQLFPDQLPDWLSWDAHTLTLSGTPPALSSPSTADQVPSPEFLTLVAVDADGDRNTVSFPLTIEADTSPVLVDNWIDNLLSFEVGIFSSFNLPRAIGGNGDIDYQLFVLDANQDPQPLAPLDLSPGISFHPRLHTISGIPTVSNEERTLRLVATDSDVTNPDTGSVDFRLRVLPANTPPEVSDPAWLEQTMETSPGSGVSKDEIDLNLDDFISDADQTDQLTYRLLSPRPAGLSVELSGSQLRIVDNVDLTFGKQRVLVEVSDGRHRVRVEISVYIPNQPPAKLKELEPIDLTTGETHAFNWLENFVDPEGGKLRIHYIRVENSTVLAVDSLDQFHERLDLDARAPGTTRVSFTVSDPFNPHGNKSIAEAVLVRVNSPPQLIAGGIQQQSASLATGMETIEVDVADFFTDRDLTTTGFDPAPDSAATELGLGSVTSTEAGIVSIETVPDSTRFRLRATSRGSTTINLVVTDTDPHHPLTTATSFRVDVANTPPTSLRGIGPPEGFDPIRGLYSPSTPSGFQQIVIPFTEIFTDPDVVDQNQADRLRFTIGGATPADQAIVRTSFVRDPAGLLPYGDPFGTIRGLKRGTARVVVKAFDDQLLQTSQQFQVEVLNQAPIQKTPQIDRIDFPHCFASSPPVLEIDGLVVGNPPTTIGIGDYFCDPDNDPITLQAVVVENLSPTDPNQVDPSLSPRVSTTNTSDQLAVNGLARGRSVLTLTIADSEGLTTEFQFTVSVANQPPVAQSAVHQTVGELHGEGFLDVDASELFSDPDGDPLTYTIDPDPFIQATSIANGIRLTLSSVPQNFGTYQLTLRASDLVGMEDSLRLLVRVVPVPIRANPVNPLPTQLRLTRDSPTQRPTHTITLSDHYLERFTNSLSFVVTSGQPQLVAVSYDPQSTVVTLTGLERGETQIEIEVTETTRASRTDLITVHYVNRPPVLAESSPGVPVALGPTTLTDNRVGGYIPSQISLSQYFTDPDGDALSYRAESSNQAIVTATIVGGTSLQLDGVARGQTIVTIYAADPGLSETEISRQLTVIVPNRAPVAQSSDNYIEFSLVDPPRTLDLDDRFSDPDDDGLIFRLVGNPSNSNLTVELDPTDSSLLTLTPLNAPVDPINVVVEASDNDSTTQLGLSVFITHQVQATGQITNVSLDKAEHTPIPESFTIDLSRYFVVGSANTPLTYNITTNSAPTQVAAGLFAADQAHNRVLRLEALSKTTSAVTITTTATDSQGNTATQTVLINVVNSAPVAPASPQPIEVNVDRTHRQRLSPLFSDADQDELTYTVSPGFDETIVTARIGSTQDTLELGGVAEGTTTVMVTGSDQTDTAVASFLITVSQAPIPNRAPYANSSPHETVLVSQVSRAEIPLATQFFDPDEDDLSFAIDDTFDTGVVTATIGPTSVGQSSSALRSLFLVGVKNNNASSDTTVTVTATDPEGLTSSKSFSVTVRNGSPKWISPPLSTFIISPDEVVRLPFQFSDPEDNELVISTVVGAPGVVQVASAPGSDPEETSPFYEVTGIKHGSTTITITATDRVSGLSASSPSFTFTVTNRAPTVSGIDDYPTLFTYSLVWIDLTQHFTDPDEDQLTYSLPSSSVTNSIVEGSVCSVRGASSCSGEGNWLRLAFTAKGTETVTVRATDTQTDFTETSFSVTIVNSAPQANSPGPVIPDLTIGVPETLTELTSHFTDIDPNDTLTVDTVTAQNRMDESTDPDRVSVSYHADTDSLIITPLHQGEATVSVTVTDGTDSFTQTWSVVVINRPPQAAASGLEIPDLTITQPTRIENLLSYFSDPDPDDVLTVASVSGRNPPANLTDPSRITVSYQADTDSLTITSNHQGEAIISVTVTDSIDSFTQTWAVTVINQPPSVVGTVPAPVTDLVVGGNRSIVLEGVFSDPDDDPLTYVMVGTNNHVSVSGYNQGVILRGEDITSATTVTIRAEDPGGEGVEIELTVTVLATSISDAPTLLPTELTVAVGATSDSYRLSDFFITVSNSDLSFEVVLPENPPGLTVNWDGTELSLTAVSKGFYQVQINVDDPDVSGVSGSTVRIITVIVPNRPPEIQDTFPPRQIHVGESVWIDLSTFFSDPDPQDRIRFRTVAPLGGELEGQICATKDPSDCAGTGSWLLVQANGKGNRFTITVIADDGEDQTSSPLQVSVPNRNPQRTSRNFPNQVSWDTSNSIDLNQHFTDPDGDTLEFSLSGSENSAVLTAELCANSFASTCSAGSFLRILPMHPGTVDLTITVNDGSDSLANLGGEPGIITHQLTLTVPDRVPIQNSEPAPIELVVGEEPVTVDLSRHFSDPEGNSLTFAPFGLSEPPAFFSVTPADTGLEFEGLAATASPFFLTYSISDGENQIIRQIRVTVTEPDSEPSVPNNPNPGPIFPGGGGGVPPTGQNPPPPDFSPPVASTFTDTADNTHQENIAALADRGITRGCNPPANTQYCPERAVTRAEMATFLVRALDLSPSNQDLFVDDNTNTHQANINSLATAGITRGCNPPENTRFCPEQPVTRAQMATFLARGLDLDDGDGDFTDVEGSVHTADINRILSAGITRGCNPPANTRFCPQRSVTRAEMATFLIRALDLSDSSG